MEGEVAEFKNRLDSAKCDLVEAKADQFKESTASNEWAKNENNGLQQYPLRSMLNLLLLNILICIPLCFYDVYVTDGFVSRRFAVFVLSAIVVLLTYALGSKMIGATNENNPLKWEMHGVSINHLLLLLNFVLAPLRLHEVYITDGIFSLHFAHIAVCTFSLCLIHLKLCGLISAGPCVVLLPAFISLFATPECGLLFGATMAGGFIFAIIICYILGMYEGDFGKESDGTSKKEI